MLDNYSGQKDATVDLVERVVREWFDATVVKRKVETEDGKWVEIPSLSDARARGRSTKGIEVSA